MLKLDITLMEGLEEPRVFELRDANGEPVMLSGTTWQAYYRPAGQESSDYLRTEVTANKGRVLVQFPGTKAGGGVYELYRTDSMGQSELVLRGEVTTMSSLPERSDRVHAAEVTYRVQLDADGDVLQVQGMPVSGTELIFERVAESMAEIEEQVSSGKEEIESVVAGAKQELAEQVTESKAEIDEYAEGAKESMLAYYVPKFQIIASTSEIKEENVIYYYQYTTGKFERYMLLGEQVISLDINDTLAGQISDQGKLKALGTTLTTDNAVYAYVGVLKDKEGASGTVKGHIVRGATKGSAGVVKMSADFFSHDAENGLQIMRAGTSVEGLVRVSLATQEKEVQIDEGVSLRGMGWTVPTVARTEELITEGLSGVNSTVETLRRHTEEQINNVNTALLSQWVETKRALEVAETNAVYDKGKRYRVHADGYVEVWGVLTSSNAGVYSWNSGIEVGSEEVKFFYDFERNETAGTGFSFNGDIDVQVTPYRRGKISADGSWYCWLCDVAVLPGGDVSVSVYMPKNTVCYIRVSGYNKEMN